MGIQTVSQAINNEIGGSPFGYKNRIINGDMRIAQYNTASVTVSTTNGDASYRTVDRTYFAYYGSSYPSGPFTTSQDTDVPTGQGFVNSYKVLCNGSITWDTSRLGCWFIQKIEGYNVADLMLGTVYAKQFTFSFWVKAKKTGTLAVAFVNGNATRSYTTTVTVNAADTWEYKTVTLKGDTDGTWLKNINNGLSVVITPSMASTWLATATLNTWQASQYEGTTTQTNFLTTSGDYMMVTGLQLEVGKQATPFDFRPYGTEMSLCQRYFEKNHTYNLAPAEGANIGMYGALAIQFNTTDSITSYISYNTHKRATPSVTVYRPHFAIAANDGKVQVYAGNAWITSTAPGSGGTEQGFHLNFGIPSNGTAGASYIAAFSWSASAEL